MSTVREAEGVFARINDVAARDGARPMVLSTPVDDQVREAVRTANACFLDFFDAFLSPLELELSMQSAHVTGYEGNMAPKDPAHSGRIDSVNYARAMMERNQFPHVDVTECSIEEIASRILDRLKLERHIRA